VQGVTQAASISAQAMEQVLTIAEQTDLASRSVLTAADEVGHTADTLGVEVNDFVSTMKRDGSEERRIVRWRPSKAERGPSRPETDTVSRIEAGRHGILAARPPGTANAGALR
jgi:hypothetical protein